MKLENGVEVVDLSEIRFEIPYGYFMDVHGGIWSTRETGYRNPVKVETHKFDYSDDEFVTIGEGEYRVKGLYREVKRSYQWRETFIEPMIDALIEISPEETEGEIRPTSGGYVVGMVKHGGMVVKPLPRIHATKESAVECMAQLKKLDPWGELVLLKIEEVEG